MRQTPMLLVFVALGLTTSCYESAPHRVEVASAAQPKECAAVIESVFARSGFVDVMTPPGLSMLFRPRFTGPRDPSSELGFGVGVRFLPDGPLGAAKIPVGSVDKLGGGDCRFELEALSSDPDCPDQKTRCGITPTMPMGPSEIRAPYSGGWEGATSACPRDPTVSSCPLTPVRGKDYDAAVDELGQRMRVALGQPPRAP